MWNVYFVFTAAVNTIIRSGSTSPFIGSEKGKAHLSTAGGSISRHQGSSCGNLAWTLKSSHFSGWITHSCVILPLPRMKSEM